MLDNPPLANVCAKNIELPLEFVIIFGKNPLLAEFSKLCNKLALGLLSFLTKLTISPKHYSHMTGGEEDIVNSQKIINTAQSII